MKFKSSILVIICLFVMHTFSVSASDIDFDDIFNSCEYEEIIEYLQNSDYIQKEYPSITAAQFQQGYIFYYADAESFLNYDYTANITPVVQAKTLWCWAATAEMAGKKEEHLIFWFL